MKKVLVTGGTGFVGRQSFASLLARDFKIHAVYHDAPLDVPGVVWHKADLLDKTAIEELCKGIAASHLLHFAWYAVHGKYWTSPENEKWKVATGELLRSFQKQGGVRAMIAGSCAEYDWEIPQDSFSEDSPTNPATIYGQAKHETRVEAEKFCRENGISLAWGRLFFLYGPFESNQRLVPHVINSLLEGKPANCSSGKQIRDFLHVSDAADAFCATLDSRLEGAINIGSAKATSIREVVLSIAEHIGRSDLINLGALPDRAEPARIIANTTRLQKELEWHPKIDWNDGIAQTIEWWKHGRV